MAAIFFAILALIGIWGTFFLSSTGNLGVPFTLPAAAFLSGFIALCMGGWFGFKKLKAKAATKELDKTLNAQADDQERNARPDLQPQVQEMRAEFQKAVSSLKSSRLGRSGADALSALPWYVIIGPPGTGKSTALRNSGLKFPYLGKKGGVRGVGGTRNCDWWLTNEGVILDTAGRYVTEEDDQEEWLSFLDAVSKARPRRPINGLIVTISAADLLTLDDAGAAALGGQLRERVDEVTGRLHLLVPVYLLVTKCDLLSGFVETFGHLPKSERGQIWGATFERGASHPDGPGELVREKLDELVDVLQERATVRLAQERKMEAREKIHRFPRQLRLLRSGLGEVAQALFTENPYQDTPLLRGVYFTSGTQEGRPIDKVMSAMAESFGLRANLASGDLPTDARSYFLGGLFTDVIFKDLKLATRSSRAVQLQKQKRYLYAGVAVGISALLIVWPFLAFSSMRSQANALVERVKDVDKVSNPEDRLKRLEALRNDLLELREQSSSAARKTLSFGMDRRAELVRAIEPVYGQWMRDLVVADVLQRDAEALKQLPDSGEAPEPPVRPRRGPRGSRTVAAVRTQGAGQADQETTFEQLKRHMLLSLRPTDPPANDKDLLDKELQSLAGPMAADFKKASGVGAPEEEIAKDLALMFDVWPRYRDAWQVPRQDELKRKAQNALKDMDRTRRMLDLEVRRWTKGEQDLNLAALTGDTSVFDTDKVVRAAFTKKVWDEKAKDALEKPPADDEAWLLDQQPATGAQIQEALKREYYTQYVREWTNMLTSIELRPVRSPDEVRRRMEVLNVGGSSPLLENLFAQVTSNLVLTLPKPGFALPPTPDAQTVTDTFFPLAKLQPAKIPPFLKKFMPSGGARGLDLSRYESLLADFAKAVDGAKDAASAAGVAKSWRGEVNNLSSVIANQQQNHTYEAVLDQLWVRPLRRMVDALDAETRQGLNYKWCADVFTLHRNELHGRYPFAKGGSDANLDALVELYGGKGKLWDFAKQSLDGKVVEAEQGSFKRLGGESVTDSLLSYLTHAKTVREAVFPGDAPNPAVDFTVQIHIPKLPNIQGVNYFVDDQQARQDSGPLEAPFSMHWPGNPKGPKRSSISIKLTGTRPFTIGCHGEQECSGPFAFLRLLEQGKLIPRGPRSFTMAWVADLGGAAPAEVSIDFAWQRSVSVFFGREGLHAQPLLGVFRALEPPAAIVPGVEGCK